MNYRIPKSDAGHIPEKRELIGPKPRQKKKYFVDANGNLRYALMPLRPKAKRA